jgi:AraC family transcriptional regulator
MNMHPKFEVLKEKKLIGKRIKMSFSDNKTLELWQSFMPLRKTITNNIGLELYSVEIYHPHFFDNFDPTAIFDKWAAIEVKDFNAVPAGMEQVLIPGGLYAVFVHKGPASEGPKTYQYIFGTWLPNAKFLLDNRPHFALMGEKYKNNDPASEEELWIPIKPKE